MHFLINRMNYYIMNYTVDTFCICVEHKPKELKQIAGPYMTVEEAEADISASVEKWEREQWNDSIE